LAAQRPTRPWSDWVRKWDLLRFGPATKTNERRSLAKRPHDRDERLAAKHALKYPPVQFSGVQARAIANGFAKAVRDAEYAIHACAIMPDHVHVVVARHSYTIEQIVGHLKAAASRRMREDGVHPMKDYPKADGSPPSPWAHKRWKRFLNDPAAVRRAIGYVNDNPTRDGMRRQMWRFVAPYDG